MEKGSVYGSHTNARRLSAVKTEVAKDKGSVYGSHTNARRLSAVKTEDAGDKGSVYGSLINAQRLISINAGAFTNNASLHSRIGGDAMVSALVRYFYGKALRDRRINMFFDFADGKEMERQIQQQIAFLKVALGGPKNRDVHLNEEYTHLESLGLADTHFAAVAEHLAVTLREQNVPHQLIDEMLAFCESVRQKVLG